MSTRSKSALSLAEAKDGLATRFASLRVLQWCDIAAGVALLAWLVSLLFISRFHTSYVGADTVQEYFAAAQRFLEGQGYQAFGSDVYRGPGFPLALAAITSLLQGDMFTASKVVAVTSSVLFLLFAYLLLRRVFDPKTALAAVLLTMAVNTIVFVSIAAGSDLPFAAPAIASLYFIARSEEPTRSDAILSGLLGGMAITVRWTGLLLPLFSFAWIGLTRGRELTVQSKALMGLLYVVAFFITSGPWLYINNLLHGSPFYNDNLKLILDPNIFPASATGLDSMFRAFIDDPQRVGLGLAGKLFGSFPMVIQGLNSWTGPYGWVMAGPFWITILAGAVILLMRLDRVKLWFLLISSVWWASLVPFHFQARLFLLLVPTFSALAVYVLTSNTLPDLKLVSDTKKMVRITEGHLLGWIIRSQRSRWATANLSGVSVTNMVLTALLTVTVFGTLQFYQGDFQRLSARLSSYHELARLIHQLEGPGLLRPVGTRQFSSARYWIPRESGVPVAELPSKNYQSYLPGLSYILYDQLDGQDTLNRGADDPNLSELRDPLRAPANLEAVYFKSTPYRAILYRILDQNKLAEITTASASSALPENPATQVFDNDSETWWSSPLRSSANTRESITLDLGRLTAINRVWLLPRPGGQGFPLGLAIDVSQDGSTWQSVTEVAELGQPTQQNPQIFSFPEISARFLRITCTHLYWDEAKKGYLVSLAEIRVSQATERPDKLAAFSLASTDLLYDPLTGALVAKVHNQSMTRGQTSVIFSEGWTIRDAQPLGAIESSIAEPGDIGVARLSSDEFKAMAPGVCKPIWAAIRPQSYGKMALDTYSVVSPQPQTVLNVVCSPKEIVIDDFSYDESPLALGWTVPSSQTTTGEVTTIYDEELGKRVMKVSTLASAGFVVQRQIGGYGRSHLSLSIKATPDFIIYVAVRDLQGGSYYVQYMPRAWGTYPQEFPKGKYVYYPLGSNFADGKWHRLETDVYKDFAAKTGKEVDCIESLMVRAYGDLALAQPQLGIPH